MIDTILKYTFLQHAIIGAILASIICGVIGTIIVEKKLVMMSGGIAHAAFGGVGMGYFLKIEPIIGALIFSIASSFGIVEIKKRSKVNTDTIIGMFWSLGMALGIIFISLTPGYPPDISSYLFGDILTVSKLDLYIMAGLDFIVIFIVIAFYNNIKAYLFDEEFSEVVGINVKLMEHMVFLLIAFSVVVLIRVVGIILVIALLTVPPAISKMFTYNLKKIMMFSILFGVSFSLIGLFISYKIHIASGASIIIVAVSSYIIVSIGTKLLRRIKWIKI
ncbi:metal ABC transporter permease [Clostridium vincentii]|uniref:Manganese transport system membrane protein MntB n=1 Tax=Clostridium vincentii TaxID=52704 RepID=A0A2T0BAW5_9CLOT|nr:metal ABC transporter permease [Clostridium vincentii]PRR81031.1 Manganese transport system membrane protein MntB [Clostridium vincentii]